MLTEKDFSMMEFNPLNKRALISAYPKLKGVVGDSDDKMMRYVLLPTLATVALASVADAQPRRGSREALVPIDRDPVPNRYSDLVRRYYEELGKER